MGAIFSQISRHFSISFNRFDVHRSPFKFFRLCNRLSLQLIYHAPMKTKISCNSLQCSKSPKPKKICSIKFYGNKKVISCWVSINPFWPWGLDPGYINSCDLALENLCLIDFTLPRRGYRFCGSEEGGLLKPPLRNQWWSGLRPHVAIDIFLRYKFRDHMQKFGPLSQKLTEISRFWNLVKLKFHVTLVYKNCLNLLNFEATGLIFCMQAWFY